LLGGHFFQLVEDGAWLIYRHGNCSSAIGQRSA